MQRERAGGRQPSFVMIRKFALIALAAGCLFGAVEDGPRQRVQVTKTEHMDFVAGGTVRLENAVDEVTLEGWDRPEVEITTVVSTKDAYGAGERTAASSRLDQVKLTAARRGDEMVISGQIPRSRKILWNRPDYFYMEARIKLPRGARLVVRHHTGEVHVSGLTGDVDVQVPRGLIVLGLPPDGKYDIDAKSSFGNVISDFPGHNGRRFWLTGHRFVESTPAGARKLHLRIGYGDIEILKTMTQAAPTS